ncbi:SufE family protein [Salinarimonas soli]|uniref:SufE family protein n=1 Tax=Salinarimonas soli TaxID=1638099 RepID=A0A5B2W0X5_9HYPH|nr:SufE family protein [Salinarimonas soli]
MADVAAGLEREFAELGDWDARIARVLALGRALPALDPAFRTEDHKVKGCQSQVWLRVDHDPRSGRLRLAADSDALLMRGLLAVVLRLYDDRGPGEILAHPADVLDRLAVSQSLAPNRANGLHLVIKRIHAAALDAPGGHLSAEGGTYDAAQPR